MATKLYLRASADNGLGSGSGKYRDLSTTDGARVYSSYVTAVSGDAVGSQRQFCKEISEGNALVFSTPPVASAFTLSGTVSFSVWGLEGSMNANVGMRARLYKRTAAGVETEIGSGYNDGVEMGTSLAELTWTGTPTSTAFAVGDRLLVKFFTTPISSTSATAQSRMDYNGANAATGDSFIQLTETVSFSANPALGTFWDEQFETNPGTDMAWSVPDNKSASATIDVDYPASAPNGGSQSVRFVIPDNTFAQKVTDFGEKRKLFGRVQIYVESHDTVGLNYLCQIITCSTDPLANAPAFLAQLVKRGSDYNIEVDPWFNGGSNHIEAVTGFQLNTPYVIEWKWDLTNSTWEVWCDGVSVGSGSLSGTALSVVPSHLTIGASSFNTNNNSTFQIDWVALSDTARLGLPPISGTGSAAFPSLSASGAGTVASSGGSISGTGTLAFPSLANSASGKVDVVGSGSVSLPSPSLAGAGTNENHGSASVSLLSASVSSAGTVETHGTATSTLLSLSTSASGTVETHGSGTPVLLAPATSSAGTVAIAGSATISLLSMQASSAGTVDIVGSGSAVLPAWTAAGVATDPIVGQGSIPLLSVAGSAQGTVDVVGAGTVSLLTLSASAAGTVGSTPNAGEGAFALLSPQLSGAGSVETHGAGNVVLLSPSISSAGAVEVVGQGAVTLLSFSASSSGTVEIHGAVAASFGMQASGSGQVEITATGTPQLLSLGVSGEATSNTVTEGSGSFVLPTLSAAGTGGVETHGTASVSLFSVSASGAGSVETHGESVSQLLSLQATGAGSVDVTGTGSTSFELSATGQGKVLVSGSGTVALPVFHVISFSSNNDGEGSLALPPLQVEGSASVAVQGSGAASLPLFSVSGTAEASISGSASILLFGTPAAEGTGAVEIKGDGLVVLPLRFITDASYVDIDENATRFAILHGEAHIDILHGHMTAIQISSPLETINTTTISSGLSSDLEHDEVSVQILQE